MPAPISYDLFLANVNQEDLNMLTAFTVGQRVIAATGAEADALFIQATRLHDAGLLVELHRVYVSTSGAIPTQAFDGMVNGTAKGYLARLARERVQLSRDPIPAEPVQP